MSNALQLPFSFVLNYKHTYNKQCIVKGQTVHLSRPKNMYAMDMCITGINTILVFELGNYKASIYTLIELADNNNK